MPVYRPACEDAYLSLVFSEGVFISEFTGARRWEHGGSPDAQGRMEDERRRASAQPVPRTAAAPARAAQPVRVAPPAWTATGSAPPYGELPAQIAFSPLGTPEDSTRRSAPEYRAPERSSVVGAGHGCQPSAEAPPDISHHSKGDPQDQRRAERQVGRGPERGRCHRAAELMNEQGNSRPQNSSDQYVAGIVHPEMHPA